MFRVKHHIYLFYLVVLHILSGNAEHVVIYTNHGIYQFYLVGVYILSGNAENVVIYTNHGIYQFYLVGVYMLSGNPEHVVLGDNVTVTLTCSREDIRKYVKWSKDTVYVATIRNECEVDSKSDNTYTYTCDLVNNIYYLHIPPDDITDVIQNVEWQCPPFTGTASNEWSLTPSGTYSTHSAT